MLGTKLFNRAACSYRRSPLHDRLVRQESHSEKEKAGEQGDAAGWQRSRAVRGILRVFTGAAGQLRRALLWLRGPGFGVFIFCLTFGLVT